MHGQESSVKRLESDKKRHFRGQQGSSQCEETGFCIKLEKFMEEKNGEQFQQFSTEQEQKVVANYIAYCSSFSRLC